MKFSTSFINDTLRTLFVKVKNFLRKISFFPLVLFLALLPYRVLRFGNSIVLSQFDILYLLLLFILLLVLVFNGIPYLVNTRCFQLFFFYCLVIEEKIYSDNEKEANEGKAFLFVTALWVWYSQYFMLVVLFLFGLYTHIKNQFFQRSLLETEIKNIELHDLPFEKLIGLANIVAIKLFKKSIELRIVNNYNFTSIPKRYFSSAGSNWFQRFVDVKNIAGYLGVCYIVNQAIDYVTKRAGSSSRGEIVLKYQSLINITNNSLYSVFPEFKQEWNFYTSQLNKFYSSSKGLPPLNLDLPSPLFKTYDEVILNDFWHLISSWDKVLDIKVDLDMIRANGISPELFTLYTKIKELEIQRTQEALSLAVLSKFEGNIWNTVYVDIVASLQANDLFMQKFIWHLRGKQYSECVRFCTLFVENFICLPGFLSPIIKPMEIRDPKKIDDMFAFIDKEMENNGLICQTTTLKQQGVAKSDDDDKHNPDYFPGPHKATLMIDEKALEPFKKIKGPDTKAPSIRSDWWFSDFF